MIAAIQPYEVWKSPITTEIVTGKSIRMGQIAIQNEEIYWSEMHPFEKGRTTVLRWKNGNLREIIPSKFNVSSKVHEYGGGAFAIQDNEIVFANYKDQFLYRISSEKKPFPITSEKGTRYADMIIDLKRGVLFAIQEKHELTGDVINRLVKVDLSGIKKTEVLHSGFDFYASPNLDPSKNRLSWITWNHPNMPWDGSELWIGTLDASGSLISSERVAGGDTESIYQPLWNSDNVLYFISDRNGYWNLYRYQNNRVESLCPMEAEFGEPQWIFGTSRYAFVPNGQIACIYTIEGVDHLGMLNLETEKLQRIDLPFTVYKNLKVINNHLVFEGGSSTFPLSIILFDYQKNEYQSIRKSFDVDISPSYFSSGEVLSFPTSNDQTAYAFYYPPHNPDYSFPKGELPPLIVECHGGPSGHRKLSLDLETQFWTSRGFGVLAVNYRGSTGYGRAYRERLKGNWGIVDVEDAINGALYLSKQGKVDHNRMIIRGGSAGGYTTLAALAFHNVFKAGTSYFGIADLEALAQETHKFESHYLDGLIGPYPQTKDLYIKRSPIHSIETLSTPLLILQGSEDKIVPPNQAEAIYHALKNRGIPVSYLLFEKEGHGFRSGEIIKRSIQAELYFYSQIFNLHLTESINPIPIDNLKKES